MLCSHCGSQLRENANFCSSCGRTVVQTAPQSDRQISKRSRLSRVLMWSGIGLGSLIALFVAAGIASSCTSETSPTPVALMATPTPAATPEPTPTPEMVHDIDIREMLDLFFSNEVAAEAEYKGKLIRATGLVESIRREDQFRLLPLDSDDFQASGLECHLVKDQQHLIIDLREGDEVTISDRHQGFAGAFVHTAKIRNCRIVNQ